MFERIVLAVDGSEPSHRAADLAAETAGKFNSDVTIVHVVEHEMSWVADIEMESRTEAGDFVDGVVRRFKESGLSARGELRRAPVPLVAQEIVDVATETDSGLVVMGTRGLTDWRGLLVGSVAHGVVHHAACPVLLVR
jgi:nucleotide-binding universal stress UspA family protein